MPRPRPIRIISLGVGLLVVAFAGRTTARAATVRPVVKIFYGSGLLYNLVTADAVQKLPPFGVMQITPPPPPPPPKPPAPPPAPPKPPPPPKPPAPPPPPPKASAPPPPPPPPAPAPPPPPPAATGSSRSDTDVPTLPITGLLLLMGVLGSLAMLALPKPRKE